MPSAAEVDLTKDKIANAFVHKTNATLSFPEGANPVSHLASRPPSHLKSFLQNLRASGASEESVCRLLNTATEANPYHPLVLAAITGMEATFNFLLKEGSDPNAVFLFETMFADSEKMTTCGFIAQAISPMLAGNLTPLPQNLMPMFLRCVRVLVQDPSFDLVRNEKDVLSPIIAAVTGFAEWPEDRDSTETQKVEEAILEMLSLLLALGFNPHAEAGGTTALLMAVDLGLFRCAEMLVSAGADPHIPFKVFASEPPEFCSAAELCGLVDKSSARAGLLRARSVEQRLSFSKQRVLIAQAATKALKKANSFMEAGLMEQAITPLEEALNFSGAAELVVCEIVKAWMNLIACRTYRFRNETDSENPFHTLETAQLFLTEFPQEAAAVITFAGALALVCSGTPDDLKDMIIKKYGGKNCEELLRFASALLDKGDSGFVQTSGFRSEAQLRAAIVETRVGFSRATIMPTSETESSRALREQKSLRVITKGVRAGKGGDFSASTPLLRVRAKAAGKPLFEEDRDVNRTRETRMADISAKLADGQDVPQLRLGPWKRGEMQKAKKLFAASVISWSKAKSATTSELTQAYAEDEKFLVGKLWWLELKLGLAQATVGSFKAASSTLSHAIGLWVQCIMCRGGEEDGNAGQQVVPAHENLSVEDWKEAMEGAYLTGHQITTGDVGCTAWGGGSVGKKKLAAACSECARILVESGRVRLDAARRVSSSAAGIVLAKTLNDARMMDADVQIPETMLNRHNAHACGACSAVGAPHKCSVCHQAWYCNQDCQKAAWKKHKKVCKKEQTSKKQSAERK